MVISYIHWSGYAGYAGNGSFYKQPDQQQHWQQQDTFEYCACADPNS